MKKRLASLFLITVLLITLCSCGAKKVKFSYFDANFSPFFARSLYDFSVSAMTQESLLVKTNDGDDSTEPVFDAYTKGLGIADIDVDYGDDKAVCTVKLGRDIYFSDGVQMTAKDVAFSMYVYAQADYDGWSGLRDSALDGLTAYRYGTTEAESIKFEKATLEAELANPSERTKELIRSRIIYPVLREEYKWVTHLYGDDSFKGTDVENHIKKYPDPRALFAFYYSLDTGYDALSAPDGDAVVDAIAGQYDTDYKTLGLVYGNDLGSMAQECARQSLTEQSLKRNDNSKNISYIRGIEIIDDYTLKITINSVEPAQIENVLGIYVAPFHYYGKGCTFDGRGFTIDLASVAEKSAEPLGAGRYVFESYKSGKGVRFSANKSYYRDIKLVSKLYFTETGDSGTSIAHEYFVTFDNRMYVENNS